MCPKLCQTIFPSVSYLRKLVANLEALFQDVLVGALVLLEDLVDQVAAVDLGAAEARQESGGAHARNDYTERDDKRWLKHSVYYPEEERIGKRDVNFNPATMPAFPPKIRTY